jgi:predicted DNA binding CopG/RHH family protein
MTPKKPLTQIGIRIAPDDLKLAKLVAKSKGLSYQAYIRMVLHEALMRDQKRKTQ